MQQQRRRGGSNVIGWVIFILIIFGSRLLPPLANWLSQATGIQISTGMLLGGLVILFMVVSVASSLVRSAARVGRSSETSLPTGPLPPPTINNPPTVNRPPTTTRMPPTSGMPSSSNLPRLPQANMPNAQKPPSNAPRFDPVIDPRILTIGVVGLIFFGVVFFIVLALSGVI